MKTIKIIRMISRLNIGGPSYNVKLLSEELPPHFKTILISGKPTAQEGDMSYILSNNANVEHIFIPELGRSINPLNEIVAFVKLIQIFRREKPDILCTHASKAGFLGRLAAILTKVPTRVHTFHGHVFHNYFGPTMTKCIIWIERILAKFTTKIIAISELQKKELTEVYCIAPKHKVFVARLGFDLNRFKQVSEDSRFVKQKHRLPKDKFIIGIVGRLVPIKNHKLFLNIALEVLKQRDDVHFVIVGDGELRSKLIEEVIWLGIQNSVSFLGWQKDLKSIYDSLDIVTLTSLNEGTPVSLIEAQACGKPVISTRVGGVEDIVFNGKNGYIVDLFQKEKFSELIIRLLLDKNERVQMGQWGQEFVFKNYNKQTLIQKMDQFYGQFF